MIFQKITRVPSTDPLHERYASYLKERVYGSVTIMAVNFGLLLTVKEITVGHATLVIASTTVGLWIASLFAENTAYRVVHDRRMPWPIFATQIAIHRGLLVAAIPSFLILGVAATGTIELSTALTTDIVLAISATTVLILRAARTSTNSLSTALISASIQLLIAAAVIGVKLASH